MTAGDGIKPGLMEIARHFACEEPEICEAPGEDTNGTLGMADLGRVLQYRHPRAVSHGGTRFANTDIRMHAAIGANRSGQPLLPHENTLRQTGPAQALNGQGADQSTDHCAHDTAGEDILAGKVEPGDVGLGFQPLLFEALGVVVQAVELAPAVTAEPGGGKRG